MDKTGKKLLRGMYSKVLWVGVWQTDREIGTEPERSRQVERDKKTDR